MGAAHHNLDIWAPNYRKGIKTEHKPFQFSCSTMHSEDRTQTPQAKAEWAVSASHPISFPDWATVQISPQITGSTRPCARCLTAPSALPFGRSPYDKSSFRSGRSAPSLRHSRGRRAVVPLREPGARGSAAAPQGDPPPERPLGFARHSDLTNQRTAYGRQRGIPPIRYPLLEAASKRHRGSPAPWRPALPVTLMAAPAALGEARRASGFPAEAARCGWWVQAERRRLGSVPPWSEFGRARAPAAGIPP